MTRYAWWWTGGSGLGGTGVEVSFCETWMVCIEGVCRNLARELRFMRVTVRTIHLLFRRQVYVLLDLSVVVCYEAVQSRDAHC